MTYQITKKLHPYHAIFYEHDGFNIKGSKLMGRQAAGWSYLKALIQSGTTDKLGVYTRNNDQRELLTKDVSTLLQGERDIQIEFIPYNRPELSQPYGGILLPGPNISEYARDRSFFGHHLYSLVGITHTTASHAVMSGISSILTEPVMPWDAVICTSESVYDTIDKIISAQYEHLSERLSASKKILPKFPIIPLGIDYEEFSYSEEFKRDSRLSLGIGEKDIVVVYVGRLSFHAKAHHLPMYMALEACSKSLKDERKIHLIQTGWFPNDFIENVFKSDANLICPSIHCHFIDGKDQSNKHKTFAAGDIFMSLSDNIQETFGLTPLEGMAAGLPVIVSDWNGYRSTVRNGKDGYRIQSYSLNKGFGEELAHRYMMGLINYDHYIGESVHKVAIDIKDCIEKLQILLTNKDKRKELGKNARKRAKDFSWDKILSQYRDLSDELNGVRMAEYKNYKDTHKSRLPSDRMDPFYLFEKYPSEVLSDDTVFFITEGIQELQIEELINLESVNYSKNTLPKKEDLIEFLEHLNKGNDYSINKLCKVTKVPKDKIFKIIIFLLKFGFIATYGAVNE